MNPSRRAVIDIGTNSIKLLVGEVREGIVHPIDERSEQTRLGAGFYDTHLLQETPIARTASAVAKFCAYAVEQDSELIRVIATSAARDAKNPDDLVSAVRRASGLRVEIISGDQEAEWVYRGVTSDERFHGKPLLILDVGGGSTEFILGNQEHHEFRQSFPLGSVRLLEKLRPHDPPSIQDLASCRGWLQEFSARQLEPAMKSILTADVRRRITFIGTGGTTTILARMAKKLAHFAREAIDGTCLTRQQILDYMVHLWSLPLCERRKIDGLPGNRADVIIMGVAIYEAVMQHFDLQEVHVSTRGLRFGALLDSP
ncbi:MAG: exopolyphosphatase / guanosine-5-triphosphate,3-diphosphate pyrophosphatase [Verrucomicrobiota bacterium]|jgi:exopolyphosphatase/guanosine-5'-triphosphate,3'-diphosphate pyrophosphatase